MEQSKETKTQQDIVAEQPTYPPRDLVDAYELTTEYEIKCKQHLKEMTEKDLRCVVMGKRFLKHIKEQKVDDLRSLKNSLITAPRFSYVTMYGLKIDVSYSMYRFDIDFAHHPKHEKEIRNMFVTTCPFETYTPTICSPTICLPGGNALKKDKVFAYTPLFYNVAKAGDRKIQFVHTAENQQVELICEMNHPISDAGVCSFCQLNIAGTRLKKCVCPCIVFVKRHTVGSPCTKNGWMKSNYCLSLLTHHLDLQEPEDFGEKEDEDFYEVIEQEVKKSMPSIIFDAITKTAIDTFFKVLKFSVEGGKKVADKFISTAATNFPTIKDRLKPLEELFDYVIEKLDMFREYCVEHPTEMGAVIGFLLILWKWRSLYNHAHAYYLDQDTKSEAPIASVFPLSGVIGVLGDNPSLLVLGSFILREKWANFIKQEGKEQNDLFGMITKAIYGGSGFTVMCGSLMVAINFAAYATIDKPKNYYNSLTKSERPKYTALLKSYGYREAIERHSSAKRGKNGKKISHFYSVDDYDEQVRLEDEKAKRYEEDFEEENYRQEERDALREAEEERAEEKAERDQFYRERAEKERQEKKAHQKKLMSGFTLKNAWGDQDSDSEELHSKNPRASTRPKRTCTCGVPLYGRSKLCRTCGFKSREQKRNLVKNGGKEEKHSHIEDKGKKTFTILKQRMCACGQPVTSGLNRNSKPFVSCQKCFKIWLDARNSVIKYDKDHADKDIDLHAKIPTTIFKNVVHVFRNTLEVGFGTLISKNYLIVTAHGDFNKLTHCEQRIHGLKNKTCSLSLESEIQEGGLVDPIAIYKISGDMSYVSISRAVPINNFRGKIVSPISDQVTGFVFLNDSTYKALQYDVDSTFGDCGSFLLDTDKFCMVGLHCGVKKNTKNKQSSTRVGLGIPFTPFILDKLSAF